MRFLILYLLFLVSFIVKAETAKPIPQTKTIEERLLELEEHKRVMDAWYTEEYLVGKGRMLPFLGETIYFGGFFEGGITHIYGDDMPTQTTTNAQGLGLNFSANFSDKIRFVTQTLTVLTVPLQNPHNNPNARPLSQRQFAGVTYGSTVTQGYLEISKNEFFNYQMGLGYAPFGYSFQQRELVLFHKRGGPQMLGYADSVNIGIASALWTGVHIYGQFPIAEERVGYNAYTFTTGSNVGELGLGSRLWWAPSENLTIGASVQSGAQVDSHFFSHGVDVVYNFENYGVLAEYAYSSYSGEKRDSETYYLEPFIKFANDQWLFYVATDYLNVPERLDPLSRVPDPIEVWEHSIGFNWLPLPNVRLRLGYVKYDYTGENSTINNQKRDWNSFDFSTGIAF